MLNRADILINRIREESDTVDENSLSDFVMLQYLNDAQRCIQNVIFQSDQLNNVFTTYASITKVADQVEYDLPSNVYAENSIISVWTLRSGNRTGSRYLKNEYGERTHALGYSVRNRKIIFNNPPDENILVIYNYRLPAISTRVGTISNIASQDVTLTNITTDFENKTEYVSVVDKYGVQKGTEFYIDGFSSPTLTLEGDLTGLSNGEFIVMGKSASTHSSLPEECETFLKVFVQRKVLAHINSKKIANVDVFTQQERKDIEDLFADKHSDIEFPVVIDPDYMDV